MKYANPDYKSYLIEDEAEQRTWWSTEKHREIERTTMKSGVWPAYVYASLSLLCFFIFVYNLLAGDKIAIVITYFCCTVAWGWLAVHHYSQFKKAKARSGNSKTHGA